LIIKLVVIFKSPVVVLFRLRRTLIGRSNQTIVSIVDGIGFANA
jgi:hypothetical protein